MKKLFIDLRSCEGIVFYLLSLSKNKTGFFITSRYPRVLSAFGVVFQEKLNYIKATKFFLYDPLTTSLVRFRRDYTV
jgi:hypothetical protein